MMDQLAEFRVWAESKGVDDISQGRSSLDLFRGDMMVKEVYAREDLERYRAGSDRERAYYAEGFLGMYQEINAKLDELYGDESEVRAEYAREYDGQGE